MPRREALRLGYLGSACNKQSKIYRMMKREKQVQQKVSSNWSGNSASQLSSSFPGPLWLWEFISVSCVGSTSGPQRWRADQVERWKIKELYAVDKRWLRTEVKRDSQVWRIRLLKVALTNRQNSSRTPICQVAENSGAGQTLWWAPKDSVQKEAAKWKDRLFIADSLMTSRCEGSTAAGYQETIDFQSKVK